MLKLGYHICEPKFGTNILNVQELVHERIFTLMGPEGPDLGENFKPIMK